LLLFATACSRIQPPSDDGPDGSHEPSSVHAHLPQGDASSDVLVLHTQAHPPFPEAEISLLESGQSPRRRLRYEWHVDRPEQLMLDIRTSLAGDSSDGQAPRVPLPSVRVVVALDPKTASVEGDLIYDWHVTSGTVTDEDRVPADVAKGMRAEVGAVEHLSGTGVVSSRGLTKDLSVNPRETTDEPTSQPIVL